MLGGTLAVHARLSKRSEFLSKLKPNAGDVVRIEGDILALISSIGEDGRIFLKGGRGFATWPDLIAVVARKSDTSKKAVELRREAANVAASRRELELWSMAKSAGLAEFLIDDEVTEDDIAELETVISKAKDEKPIHEFLQANGHLLAALVGGKERFLISKVQLGKDYVPDFLIGAVDSLGIHWVLVELETPVSGIYLKTGIDLDRHARKGISQIMDWKNWLENNLDEAQRGRPKKGLGLFDIKRMSQSLVLVGRRSRMPKYTDEAKREEYRQSNDIHIHSYDWLLERLQGIIQFQGPPAANRLLFSRIDGKDE